MKPFFALEPWEYPGASFDPSPHAITRLELGGKKRTFWLKMRDGVIFFRETTRVPVFAIPHLFDDSHAHDPQQLISAWKGEVGRHNYGAFIISRRQWPRTPVTGHYCIILRANGSGWIKEHFDTAWQEFNVPHATPLDLWRTKPTYGEEAGKIVHLTGAPFLNRAVDPAHFQTMPPHWSGGGPEQMLAVLRSAAYAFLAPDDLLPRTNNSLTWDCKSNSAFWAGSVSGPFAFNPSYLFNLVSSLVKWHFGFVGIEWKKVSEHPELQEKFGAQTWKSGFEQWGENWRGNWFSRHYETQLTMPPFSAPSSHEKLESALVLREFLRDKMPADKLETLLNYTLKK